MTTTRFVRAARETVLWLGALLGLLAVAAGVAVVVAGASFLVFRSGSMSPEISTGAIGFATPVAAPDIRPGDVVSVRAADGARITHRVVSSTVRGDETSLVLKGDANSTPDAEVYVVRSVERVAWSVPYAGYVVAFAMTPLGLLAVGSICVALFLVSPGDTGQPRPAPGGGHRDHRHRRRTAGAATVLAASVAAGSVTGTQAAFNDTATTRSTFATATVTPPVGVTCVNSGSSDYVDWSAPTGYAPTAYQVFVNGSATPTATLAPATTQWQPGTTFFPQTFTVRVAAVRGSWVSVQAGPASISTLFLFQGTRCE